MKTVKKKTKHFKKNIHCFIKLSVEFLFFTLLVLQFAKANEHLNTKFNSYIQDLEKTYKCKIGVSAIYLPTGQVLEYRGQEKFPMASVIKLPLLTYLTHLEDNNQINFNEEVEVGNKNLTPGSGSLYFYTHWNPVKISIKDLIEAMIAISDNSATDLLFEKINGPKNVQRYMNKIGLKNTNISRDIYQLFLDSGGIKDASKIRKHPLENYSKAKSQIDLDIQFKHHDKFHADIRDTTTPEDMTLLLTKIIHQDILSSKNSELVFDILKRCSSQKRIRYFTPKTFTVGDKTGTWFYSANPKYTYANDVGVITLSDPKNKIALAIFVNSDEYTRVKKLDEVIAIVSKTILDIFYFNH
jgi:beta-lactamase class A